MSLWLTQSLTGLIAGPLVIFTADMITRAVPSSSRAPEGCWRSVLAASALLSLVSFEAAQRQPATAGAVAWLATVGLLLALIDWTCHRLPHRVVATLFGGGVVQLGLQALVQRDLWPLLRACAATVVVFAAALAVALISPSGLGLGDVTLAATAALFLGWFGWCHVVIGLAAAFVVTLAVLIVLRARRRIRRDQPIALGPALVFAPVCTILLA